MKKNVKKIFAITAVSLLVILYIVTFISALIGSEASLLLFRACLYGTVTIPILFWIFLQVIKYYQDKKHIKEDSQKN